MKNGLMTVGEIAKAMNVTVRTMQYYDREGLLSPTELSEGGRRMYSQKDMIRLHQILSFKALGFSLRDIKNNLLPLDTPQEVLTALDRQSRLIATEIEVLRAARLSIDALRKSVAQSQRVDFEQYANIVRLLQTDCKSYAVWDELDEKLSCVTGRRYAEDIELRVKVVTEYRALIAEALSLMECGASPGGPEGQALAERWQRLIESIAGSDPQAVAKLRELNEDRSGWLGELAEKQELVNDFVTRMFEHYRNTCGDTPRKGNEK